MTRVGGRKLELVCVLCNESLADLERACAGLLGNTNKNENNHATEGGAGLDSATVVSEMTVPDTALGGAPYGTGGPNINPPPQYGGYMPLTDHNHKQVVATKCGHMFHQGCLRKHVHKTLIEGKGGSLFCPMCTRPFAMNRLWPVIIPPTKLQRERYLQLKIMKDQNSEMVRQLKEIRAKIAEEEDQLKRIKDDSEQCLHDIQQKQKLLDSVNGPTNKEMADLTKVHMKRQEILHVVTQHNADLLKLLAEESNISTATAENMINVNVNSHAAGHSDLNQNYLPSSAHAFSRDKYASRVASGEEFPMQASPSSRKVSRKSKKDREKSKKSRSKKKIRRRQRYNQSPSRSKSRIDRRRVEDVESEAGTFSRGGGGGSGIYPPVPMPSEVMPDADNNATHHRQNDKKQTMKSQCRKVDTFTKWKIESMKELMCLPGFSEVNTHPSTALVNRDDDDDLSVVQSHHHRRHAPSHKDSVNILLSRKPNMLEKDGLGGGPKK